MQNWQKRGDEKTPKKKKKTRAPTRTHKTQKTQKKSQDPRITKKHKNQPHTSTPTKSSPSTGTAMYHLPQKEAHNRKRVPRKKGEKTPSQSPEKKTKKVGNR
jgi:hypothetical protein